MAATWLNPACLNPDVRIVGLADLNLAAAENRRNEFAPDAVVGTDAAALIAELKPEIVFNCTVPAAHYAVSMAAFAVGAHVLSEKPLANTMAEARELVSAAATANRLFAITQNRRYNQGARAARAVLAGGAIGEVTGVMCDFFIGAHFGGFRDEMEHVLLHDMAIHHFDLARFFIGGTPNAVFCYEWNPRGSWYRHGANAQAIFTFEDDIVFNYRGSWCAEGVPTSWNGAWRFIGTDGSLIWDGEGAVRLEKVKATGEFLSEIDSSPIPLEPAPGKDQEHASIIEEFVGCIRDGTVPETDAADNIHSLAMVFAAVQSGVVGERIAIIL